LTIVPATIMIGR